MLGLPVQFLMEKAFEAANLEWRYFTCNVTPGRLADAVRGLQALGFRGAHLTGELKTSAVALANELSPTAELSGSVSCLNLVNDRWRGENFEGEACLKEIRTVVEPKGKRAVLLGAGAVAKAIAVELAQAGVAQLTMVSRKPLESDVFVAKLSERFGLPVQRVGWLADYEAPADTDVIIHATSIGSGDATARAPLKLDALRMPCMMFDCVYDPPETRVLREARQRGCVSLPGAGMLVSQLALEFQLWTGIAPDLQLMRESLDEFLGF